MAKIKNPEVIDEIIKQIEVIRRDNEILSSEEIPIIRDRIFSLLESLCTVLYFPCLEEDNRGFHIIRHINGKEKEFVYINTAKSIEMQVFAAAHELGHIWKVADRIKQSESKLIEEFNSLPELEEDVVNRFAAELLMPTDTFKRILEAKLNEYIGTEKSISLEKFMMIVTYLMNEFLVPYEAVVKRINEIGKISDETKTSLLEIPAKTLKEIVESSPYKILGVITNKKEMGNFGEKLDIAEENNIFSDVFCDKYRELLGIKEIDKEIANETIELSKPEE